MKFNLQAVQCLAMLAVIGGLALAPVAQAQTASAPGSQPAAPPPVAPPAGATPPAATTPAPDATATPGTAPDASTAAGTPPAGTAPDANAAGATPDAGTAATAPPVAPPAAPDAGQVTVGNPYGLGALWQNGDIIARATLVILAIMSMLSWYVLITKGFVQARVFSQAKQVNKTFWQAGSVRAATQAMPKGTAFHYIAQSGLESLDQHNGLLDKIDIHSFTASSIDDAVVSVQSKLQDGLAILGTVGSTAPFVGLFGTVWGIYHALTAIGIAGQASIDKVAGPVGEALIMTAIGLAVAVPAVLGYNFVVRRNKQAMDIIRKFAKKVLFVLLSSDAAATAGIHSDLADEIALGRKASEPVRA
jgi:biopolymer transport protein ExbB